MLQSMNYENACPATVKAFIFLGHSTGTVKTNVFNSVQRFLRIPRLK